MASLFGPAGAAQGSPDQLHSGSFRADDLELTIPGVDVPGSLVQQVNFTLTRNVNMLYEIGSTNVYYVGNRRQGQCQMQRIVGGSAGFEALLAKYGNMCEPQPLTLGAKGGCGGSSGSGITYNLVAATLTQVGASVTAQEIVVTESLGFIFADLTTGT
jgi:hypothetical protein